MSNAKYIVVESREIEAQKSYVNSIPKLPMDIDLEKCLPKALRQLSVENYSTENTNKCNKDLITLIGLLLTNNYGVFVNMKDVNERVKVKEALELFVKIKAFKILKEYNSVIVEIFKMNIFWIRDISTWECKSRNTYKQLKSLLEHLFCEYEVPEFMFQSWTDKTASSKHKEWFLHLAAGNTARELFKYPIPITKKMAHEFKNTPFPGYSIDDAIRRSQVIGLGGDQRLADAVLMSRLRHDFQHNDFWTTVIQFFIGIPMLNLDEVGTVIDYINEQKYVPKRNIVNDIVVIRSANPGFSMKGRNITTLIRDTHTWHKELSQLKRQAGVANNTPYKIDLTSKWNRSTIRPFTFTEGKNEKRKVWNILEITHAADLYDEGKSMGHCVYSYLSSCLTGKCSIFSLCLFNTRMVTVEVRDYRAVQIRGPRNKRPTDKEMSIINSWAKSENIGIANYAVGGR